MLCKNREKQARGLLAMYGYVLKKSPANSWERKYYGPGYMILENNTVKWGCYNRQWDMSLEDVEYIISDLKLPTVA